MTHQAAREQASQWAREMLALPTGQVLILDTETCALNGEVIELAVIDTDGNALYNRRFNPLSEIEPGAQAVHGLTLAMLAGEPCFADEYQTVADLLSGAKWVLIYNASYDVRCLRHTCGLHELDTIGMQTRCLMQLYAEWYGERSARGGYKWQPLQGGDHSALGDCRAALAVLRRMAGVEAGAAAGQVVQDEQREAMTAARLKERYSDAYKIIDRERRWLERIFPPGDPRREPKLAEMQRLSEILAEMKDALKGYVGLGYEQPALLDVPPVARRAEYR